MDFFLFFKIICKNLYCSVFHKYLEEPTMEMRHSDNVPAMCVYRLIFKYKSHKSLILSAKLLQNDVITQGGCSQ